MPEPARCSGRLMPALLLALSALAALTLLWNFRDSFEGIAKPSDISSEYRDQGLQNVNAHANTLTNTVSDPDHPSVAPQTLPMPSNAPSAEASAVTATSTHAGGQDAVVVTQPLETQTGTPPESFPRAIPLERDTRDPQAAARVAAQQASDHQRQLADSAQPRPGQEFEQARVRPADLGLPFLPGSRQDSVASSRTAEAGYGRTVSTLLHTKVSIEDALSYYREQLRRSLPEARINETRQGTAWATLVATDEAAGVRLTVWAQTVSAAELAVTLTRWDAHVDADSGS